MQIIFNGVQKNIKEKSTLLDFIKTIELPKFFVVELNKKIVYKEFYASTSLVENDEIELAIFTGGG